MDALNAAYRAGVEMAEYLNSTPCEAQNWSKLGVHDELPDGDYVSLRSEFGEVTAEMEREYKRGFNDTFISS